MKRPLSTPPPTGSAAHADYVAQQAAYRASRNKRPALGYLAERNPYAALRLARQDTEFVVSLPPSTVDHGNYLIGSRIGNSEMEWVACSLVEVCRKWGDQWASFTFQEYLRDCGYRASAAHLEMLASKGWLLLQGDTYHFSLRLIQAFAEFRDTPERRADIERSRIELKKEEEATRRFYAAVFEIEPDASFDRFQEVIAPHGYKIEWFDRGAGTKKTRISARFEIWLSGPGSYSKIGIGDTKEETLPDAIADLKKRGAYTILAKGEPQ